MLFTGLLLHFSRVGFVQSAPIQNLTTLQTEIAPAWVKDPSGRGTWQLLYSCLFTIGLCVWTAIHMNVRAHNDSAVNIWLRKVKWVFIAILAPEFVAYVALQQLARAIAFRKELNVIWNEQHKTGESDLPKSSKANHFGKTYAFYAVMGGFCADVGFMHNTWTRFTVTTEGMLYLAKHGHFVDISGDSIRDKSKADLLAKGLVIFQVLWLVGQAIERKVAGYPITLLEVHTLVHVACAVCMFFMWLYKPLDVRDPTLVSPAKDGEVQECIAWLLLHCLVIDDRQEWFEKIGSGGFLSEGQNLSWQGHLISPSTDEPVPNISHIYAERLQRTGDEDSRMELITSEGQEAKVTTYFRTVNPTSGRDCSGFDILHTISSKKIPVLCSLVGGQGLRNGIGLSCSWPIIASAAVPERCPFVEPKHFSNLKHICLGLSARDVRRWDLASNFIRRLESSVPDLFRNKSKEIRFYYDADRLSDDELRNLELPIPLRAIWNETHVGTGSGQELRFREGNVRNILSDSLTSGRVLGGALGPLLVLVPAAYGAIHLSALTITFPTGIEHLLWEIACYIMIGVAAGLAILLIGLRVGRRGEYATELRTMLSLFMIVFPSYRPDITAHSLYPNSRMQIDPLPRRERLFAHALTLSMHVVFYAVCIPYIAARAYIVVESFIALRHVPIGVYETPQLNFMNYVPHL